MEPSHSHNSPLERVLTEQQWLRQSLVLIVVLGGWVFWTIWSDAEWFYQALWLFLAMAGLAIVTRPAWVLNFILLLLVGDVTGFITNQIQIPGLVGIAGVAGKAKIPELLSVLSVCHILFYFCLRPQEFRQPLVRNFVLFIAAGLIGTGIGLNQHIPTNVMRDSLAYYFSFFYIIGLVLLPTAQAAKSTFRIFYYTALLALIYCFVYSAVTATTDAFHSASFGMFFSTCAYFLAAKLFSSPPGTRRWLTLLMLPLFSCAMFIGRGRGAVLAFTIGLVPLCLALPARRKLQIALGLILPCVLVMLLLFGIEKQRGQDDPFGHAEPGARGIESFSKMGNQEYDPTGSYRIFMWQMAWHGFLESPLLGKGYGWLIPLRENVGLEQEEMPSSTIHNSFLHVLASGGLIGFIPLVLIVVRFFPLCARQYRQRELPEHRLWPACAASIGLNFFLTALTNAGFEQVNSGLTGWLLLALAVRMATTPGEELNEVIPRGLAWDASVALPAVSPRQIR